MNEKLRKFPIGEFSLKRLMTSLLLISLFVYLGLLVYAYFFADNIIFQPRSSSYRDNHAEELFAKANEPKISYWIEEADHNDLFEVGGEAYLQAIRDFADNLPK